MVYDIGVALQSLADAGFYAFVLPFLLIFAIVFGILSGTKAFGDNKMVHIILSLALGLIATRTPYVGDFFSEIFPNLGIALSVMLVVWILVMIFVPEKHQNGVSIAMYVFGAIVALFVVVSSFSNFGSFSGTMWLEQWGTLVITLVIIIAVIVAAALSGKK